ncbi:MAG: response regulator [Bacteroidales bacterium]|nr:response regulator [Bacteroidales bacterium]
MEKLRVLVVDDEPGIRSGIDRILRNFSVGYPFMDEDICFEVLEAETGEKALELVESEKIDIVLLDNKLPGIHGIDVLEIFNKKQVDLSVMMITSYASLDLAIKATNNGAYNFVPKPFTPQELKVAMESITKHLFLKRMTRKMNEEGKQIRFQFLSVLSHELKSPINAVEGYLKIMQERQVGENIADYEIMISRSIERLKGMRTLILDLLDLTKIESGKKQRTLKKINLYDAAQMAIHSIEPMAIQKNIKIYLFAPDDIYIMADSDEIDIILNNLVSNAVKYNKEDGKVEVTIKKTNTSTIIKVEDTGIGMDEEEMERLFGEFVRIKNSKTKNITGSGLGLSIVKKMVELNDGKIELSSTPDVGSVFTVVFPA